MRIVFYIYCVTYIALALIMYYAKLDLFYSKLLMSLAMLNTGFPLIGSLIVLLNPGVIKSHRTDSKYLNLCLAAGVLRILFWACAPFGLRDHITILFLNAFGLSIFALLESRFSRISNEYFKY